MENDILILLFTGATIAFVHTVLGPDHYLPFIVLAKSRNWSTLHTTLITILCGLGHVLSSVVVGLFGIALGIGVQKLQVFESIRGNWAAWAFIAFGLGYMIWGLRKAYTSKSHEHVHSHGYSVHDHQHHHQDSHVHVHDDKKKPSLTPWILFLVFVLGPCEPLIPILMYPAAKHSTWGLIMVTIVFGVVTISTMLAMVFIALKGIKIFSTNKMIRYTHAIAGGTIMASGLAIVFLGL